MSAKQRGSTNALAPVAKELLQRGHNLTIYATGNRDEAAGFAGLPYQEISPGGEGYGHLVKGFDIVIVGLSGYETPDGYFLRAANAASIPTIAAQDENSNYRLRLGTNPDDLPTILAVMNEECKKTAQTELGAQMGAEAVKRSRIVGWTALDQYAAKRQQYTLEERAAILQEIGVNPEQKLHAYFSQNIHPDTEYLRPHIERNGVEYREKRQRWFEYEMKITKAVFSIAADMKIPFAVKSHGGEKHDQNFTGTLAKRYGITPITLDPRKNIDFLLAVDSVFATRSTILTEACLLDRNTAALIPYVSEPWAEVMPELCAFPPLALEAIPYTISWDGIEKLVKAVAAPSPEYEKELAGKRLKFSVDGKAAKRFADLVENIGR